MRGQVAAGHRVLLVGPVPPQPRGAVQDLIRRLAGVIGGNYLVTEPSMAVTMGPIVFVVVVFGGLGSLAGCFIASLIMGLVQTFAVVVDVSLAGLLARVGVTVTSATPLAEVLTIPLPRIGALLPYLMLILVLLVKPRGLMGTRDT